VLYVDQWARVHLAPEPTVSESSDEEEEETPTHAAPLALRTPPPMPRRRPAAPPPEREALLARLAAAEAARREAAAGLVAAPLAGVTPRKARGAPAARAAARATPWKGKLQQPRAKTAA
jgi:hypothetical protein